MKLQSEQKLVGVAVPVVLFCDKSFLGHFFYRNIFHSPHHHTVNSPCVDVSRTVNDFLDVIVQLRYTSRRMHLLSCDE